MTNTQLFLAIGIPAILILVGIALNRQDNQGTRSEMLAARSEFHNRLDSSLGGLRIEIANGHSALRSDMNNSFGALRNELTGLRDGIHRDMVGLHERVALVERDRQ